MRVNRRRRGRPGRRSRDTCRARTGARSGAAGAPDFGWFSPSGSRCSASTAEEGMPSRGPGSTNGRRAAGGGTTVRSAHSPRRPSAVRLARAARRGGVEERARCGPGPGERRSPGHPPEEPCPCSVGSSFSPRRACRPRGRPPVPRQAGPRRTAPARGPRRVAVIGDTRGVGAGRAQRIPVSTASPVTDVLRGGGMSVCCSSASSWFRPARSSVRIRRAARRSSATSPPASA